MLESKVRVNEAYTFLQEYGPRFEVIMGGAGSGKSYSVAQHIVLAAIDPKNMGRKFLCIRKVANTLRFSVFSLLSSIISEMGLTPFFSVHKSDMTITSVSGVVIMMVGLDDVEKLKSIHGVTDVWIEEATELTETDFKQVNLRVRGTDAQKRIILTFNPISVLHWLKAYFFDNPKNNSRITRTTWEHNAFLDEAYVNELRELASIDAYFHQVYTLGEWGMLGNVVFTNIVIEDFDYSEDDFENVCNGMDFGFAHASAIERIGFKDGHLYSFDELHGRGWTNPRFIENAKEHFGDAIYDMIITADSAEPARIKEWNDDGVTVLPAKKGKDSLRFGVDYLSRITWHIHKTRCSSLVGEVQSFKRREDKDGNALDDFVEINDDGIAACRYATEWIWGQAHGIVETAVTASDFGF